MTQKRYLLHLVYGLVIATMSVGIIGLNQARIHAQTKLHSQEMEQTENVKTAFANLCAELSGDLYSAVEANQFRLYVLIFQTFSI